MRTFSTVEGLPVISLSSGREYGRVIDVLYQSESVLGFLVDQKGWLNKHLFLPLSSVLSFGHDGLMVQSKSAFKDFSEIKREAFSLKTGKRRLQGTPLLSKEGNKLGLMEDVYFLEEMGTIVGYEVTEGLVVDLLEGKKVVKAQGELVIGGGRAILTK